MSRIAASLILLLATGSAHAQVPPASQPATLPADAAQQIEQLLETSRRALQSGDARSLVTPLQQALMLARGQAPLEVSQLTVVETTPQGLGMFTPSPGAVVRSGTLLLYAEVRNFATRTTPRGELVDLGIDASFFYDDGELIAARRGIGDHRFTARTVHEVTFVVVELNLRGLPPQAYHVELSLTDRVSGKAGHARTRFVVQ